jgi:hypothetical protein
VALAKHPDLVERSDRAEFDQDLSPDTLAPLSGIYRCAGCGREEACQSRELLPRRDHHLHTRSQGLIRWRLVVAADRMPK